MMILEEKEDKLFKSRLVQSTGTPHLAVVKSSDSNGELKLDVSPSFGGADVYFSKPEKNLPTLRKIG